MWNDVKTTLYLLNLNVLGYAAVIVDKDINIYII